MKKIALLIASIIIFSNLLLPQTIKPEIAWYKIYDGLGNDVDLTNDIMLDRLSNIYLGGRSVGSGSTNLLILKYSESGDSLLELKYDSAPNSWDEALSFTLDSNLNIYVIGSATFEQNTFYAIFHKYSGDGELIWAKDFHKDTTINSEGIQVILNSKGEPVIGYNQGSAIIAKYSPSGDSLWTTVIEDDTSMYQINYLASDKSNNIYAAVLQLFWDGGDLPSTKVILIKINDTGEIIWEKKFDSNYGKKIIFDRVENPVLLAADTKIFKLNIEGDTIWTKEYPYTGDIIITSDIAVDSNNDIVFTGYGLGEDSWDYFTQKVSSSGKDIWTRIFNSDEKLKDYAMSLTLDKDDNIYVTGGTGNSISEGFCYTVKYSSEGDLRWRIKLDVPDTKFGTGHKIFVDDSCNVFVGGDIAGSVNGYNFLAFKIKQSLSTGIEASGNNIPKNFQLSQNYPNPFNPETKIRFELPVQSSVKLVIYDILGREILILEDNKLPTGYYEKNWKGIDAFGRQVSSGIYFYRFYARGESGKEYIKVMKMVMVK